MDDKMENNFYIPFRQEPVKINFIWIGSNCYIDYQWQGAEVGVLLLCNKTWKEGT